MTHHTQRTAILGVLALAATLIGPHAGIIPKPVDMKTGSGTYALSPDTRIEIERNNPAARDAADYLATTLRRSTGYTLQITETTSSKGAPNTILITSAKAPATLGKEGYLLEVRDNRVGIHARDAGGLLYGAVSFIQLLPSEIESKTPVQGVQWVAPQSRVQDQPRFSWRGMHLDVSRHFYPKEDILTYIDTLTSYKMNIFHWHLIDDGGWRLEIKKYPRLTEVGAWRNQESFNWGKGKVLFFPDGVPEGQEVYGGFYTQEDVREIVEYARKRNITVVPEIEMPGHIMPALAAYPELGSHPEGGLYRKDRLPAGVSLDAYSKAGWGYEHQNVADAGKPITYTFFKEVLDEVFELFPSEWIHIGGDEVQKIYWENSPTVAKLMENEGLQDQHQVQSYFLKEMAKHIEANGRKMVGWDEIVDGGLAPNAAVMYWIGRGRMMRALNDGHDVIMSPMGPCYFDFKYRDNSTEKVYNWDPMPEGLTSDQEKNLIGAQANVWTEWMNDWQRVEHMVLPRMIALAEALWTPLEDKDMADFDRRLLTQYARLELQGRSFRVPSPKGTDTIFFTKQATVKLDKNLPEGWDILFTLDGSTPNADSKVYDKPLIVKKDGVITASYRTSNGMLSEEPFRVHLRGAASSQVSAGKKAGLQATFIYQSFDKTPALERFKNEESNSTKSFDISEGKGHFAAAFTGTITIKKDGIYEFSIASDDGSILQIADAVIIDNDGKHSFSEKTGKAQLSKGTYPFSVRYFEAGGASRLEVKGVDFSTLRH